MTPPQITYRDPVELRLHPLQKALPDPDKTTVEWHSFVDGLAATGPEVIPPLICTAEGLVMDGGRRWHAARQLQWTLVPVMERPEHEAGALIIESLFGQRNWTRGVKAYVAVPMISRWTTSAIKRRAENLRRGKNVEKALIFPNPSDLDSEPETLSALCARWGISDETMRQARYVHALLHDPACAALKQLFGTQPMPKADGLKLLQQALREEFEKRLFAPDSGDGRLNLWNVKSAITSRIRTEGHPRTDQMDFFGDLFTKFRNGASKWGQLPKSERSHVITKWRETYESLPPDMRAEMRAAMEDAV